jgi:hypothetical protein
MDILLQYAGEINLVTRKVFKTGFDHHFYTVRGDEIYAYPLSKDRVSWGVNAARDGCNLVRGIREKSGRDSMVL